MLRKQFNAVTILLSKQATFLYPFTYIWLVKIRGGGNLFCHLFDSCDWIKLMKEKALRKHSLPWCVFKLSTNALLLACYPPQRSPTKTGDAKRYPRAFNAKCALWKMVQYSLRWYKFSMALYLYPHPPQKRHDPSKTMPFIFKRCLLAQLFLAHHPFASFKKH